LLVSPTPGGALLTPRLWKCSLAPQSKRHWQIDRQATTSSLMACRRVSHVTDATDWRVEYPFVVLTPDSEAKWPAGQRVVSSWG
jgi:hypothetical protein